MPRGSLITWQNIARVTGLVIVGVEMRQVLIGQPVDQGFLALAAGLFGLASGFRRNGSGNGKGSGNGEQGPRG